MNPNETMMYLSKNKTPQEYTQKAFQSINGGVGDKRQVYLNYMQNPAYKERLKKEMFGDTYNEKINSDAVENEYKKRLKKLNIVNIKTLPENLSLDSEYDTTTKTITSSESQKTHELSHAVDNSSEYKIDENQDVKFNENKGFQDIKNKYMDSNPKNTYENLLKSNNYKEYQNSYPKLRENLSNFIKENEKNIKLEGEPISKYGLKSNLESVNSDGLDPYKFVDVLDEKSKIKFMSENKQLFDKFSPIINDLDRLSPESRQYYNKETEIKARINFLRLRAIDEFGFDQSKNFDINSFKELKNDRQYKELKDKMKLSDEQINELSKYVANNNSTPKTPYDYLTT